jgi:nicotinate-nucleotide pyrophosphorylase (carboxylating)
MLHQARLDSLIDLALAEDLGVGDVTTTALIDEAIQGRARIVTRQPLVVAGLEVCQRVFHRQDPTLHVRHRLDDGHRAEGGACLTELSGTLASIVTAERVALNFLQRLCGIATLTRQYVDALVPGAKTVVVDTRKTTPGLRYLERYAVRCGGGHNHRPALDGGCLIKDNHIAACGSISEAVRRAKAAQGPALRIEVEVTTVAEAQEARDAGAEVIMLDNMSLDQMKQALEGTAHKVIYEASGTVTPARVPELCHLGIDFISVGALTHSAPAVDLSLQVERC